MLAGSYGYLSSDVTATGNITIGEMIVKSGANINLCLNGKTIDLGNGCIIVESGATLHICDCSVEKAGTITSAKQNGTILVEDGGTLKVTAGTVGNTTGDAIMVREGTVEISGSAIVIANNAGIRNDTGTVTVSGGQVISENDCAIYNSTTTSISGGTVKSNSDNSDAMTYYGIDNIGDLYLSGAPVITSKNAGIHAHHNQYFTSNIYAKSKDGSSSYSGAVTIDANEFIDA